MNRIPTSFGVVIGWALGVVFWCVLVTAVASVVTAIIPLHMNDGRVCWRASVAPWDRALVCSKTEMVER